MVFKDVFLEVIYGKEGGAMHVNNSLEHSLVFARTTYNSYMFASRAIKFCISVYLVFHKGIPKRNILSKIFL